MKAGDIYHRQDSDASHRRDTTIYPEAAYVFCSDRSPECRGISQYVSKGLNCFRIPGEKRVGYLDLTGSDNETSAHIAENGRITFMLCAFDDPANIVRLYGARKTILPDDPS